MKKLFIALCCLFTITSFAQVNYTANQVLNPYNEPFRAGCNPGYYGPNWDDYYLSDLAAGNATSDQKGVGIRAFRTVLPEFIALQYEMKSWKPVYEYYESLGIDDNTLVVGFASPQHSDPEQYCPGVQSQMFANLYEPIWDGGANGTQVNENNYFAKYMHDLVLNVGDQVKFWEIWNEPGFDYTGAKGWLQPGQPGNWWENNPEPCDYKLQAPIFNFIRTMRIAYEVIKTMSPDDYVVLSGVGYESFLDAILRNTDNPNGGSVNGSFPLKGGAYFDVMGFHNYPHFDGSVREWNNAIGGFEYFRHSDGAVEGVGKKMDIRYDLLASHGYNGSTYPKKLWTITEINVPREAYSEGFGSEIASRNYAIKTVENAIRNNIIQTHFWALAEREYLSESDNEFDVMGFYQRINDLEPFQQTVNESGIAYKTASDLLFDKQFDDNITNAMNLPTNVKGGAYRDANGSYTYILWAKTATDQSESASAVYTLPSWLDGSSFIKREWNYSYTGVESTISNQNILLTGTPIFLVASDQNAGKITFNCPGDLIYENPVTQSQGGVIQNIPQPSATTTCPQGGVTVTLTTDLGSGSFFPLGTTVVGYKATDACGNEAYCALTVRVASTGGGIGDCHPNRWDFLYRGLYNGNKYFQSKLEMTYEQAVAAAESHGGRLVVINDAAENAFLRQNITTTSYIGLSDAQNEGSLVWSDGSAFGYGTFDDCSYCGSNNSVNDYTEFHPWNGEYSWNDGTVVMPFIMELACSEITECNCTTVYDPVCGADGITYPNSCEAQCAGIFTYTFGECSVGECPNTLAGHDFLGEFGGHKYFISQSSENWLTAKDIAGANGGYLVSFSTSGENDFVKNNISEIVFTGFNDRGAEGIYNWASGEDATGYLNISGPNSAANDYGNMNFWDGSWAFDNQWVQRKYVVELPCEGGLNDCTTTGQACDDGNACTAGSTYDNNCNCNGGTQVTCATGNKTIQACNDGNPNTINDVQTILNCDGSICVPCAGTPDGGGGDCPSSLSGYTLLGEYGGHKYFITNTPARPADAQTNAVANGGYLAIINDAAENNFIFSNISDMVYIGLNDVASEGSLQWFSGASSYNNVNVCSFCQPNDADNDYAVMHSWDGKWSFSNQWNQRLAVIELPCAGGGECICTAIYDPVCGDGITFPNACEAECAGVFNYEMGECGSGGNNCVDNIPGFQLLATNGSSNYYLSNDNARPTDAQAIAEANGGYLASIGSQAENDLIWNSLNTIAYIGLSDEQAEGNFQWENGQTFSYSNFDICNFCVGNSATDDFVIMHSWNGGWSMSNTWNQRQFIMEIPCIVNDPFVGKTETNKVTIENIFPNPASDELFIKMESINEVVTSFAIYDITGQMKMTNELSLEVGTNYLELDISTFPAGIYQMLITDDSGRVSTRKFIKQKL